MLDENQFYLLVKWEVLKQICLVVRFSCSSCFKVIAGAIKSNSGFEGISNPHTSKAVKASTALSTLPPRDGHPQSSKGY